MYRSNDKACVCQKNQADTVPLAAQDTNCHFDCIHNQSVYSYLSTFCKQQAPTFTMQLFPMGNQCHVFICSIRLEQGVFTEARKAC